MPGKVRPGVVEQAERPLTRPDLLERVALFSSRKLVMAQGTLTMPCEPIWLEDAVARVQAVMVSLWQQPPAAVLAEWRQRMAEIMGVGDRNFRLVIAYQPLDDPLGLTGGFQIRIARVRGETGLPWPSDGTDLASLTTVQGQLKLPALPSLLDQHVTQIGRVLEGLGQTVIEAELAGWRAAIAPTLDPLFQASPNAYLVVQYRLLQPELGLPGGIQLQITGEVASIAEEYHVWTQTRQGPLFGSHADAKVLAVAAQLSRPTPASILDIGAGTGRNSLALAQRGFAVDALELAPALADQLMQAKQAAGLSLNVVQGDILDPTLVLPSPTYALIFLSEVIASHFRSPQQVRQLFGRLCDRLAPGGLLLFNAFLAAEGYQPSPAQRELAQAFWCCILTQAELQETLAGLPLQVVSQEAALAYEQAHLPAEAWPPTDWFTGWASGRNLFPTVSQPPLSLQWVLYQRD